MPIFISLSPNTEKDDIFLALRLILQPWKWKKENLKSPGREADSPQGCISNLKSLEEEFKKYLGIKHAFAFNSGRTGFLAILSALSLEKNSEILLQAFTCNAAVNPILWSGLKPAFVDIKEETLNIDARDLEKKITPRSRAVLVQHTFGLPADLDEILEICKKHNLILIEDCAHSLGAVFKGKKVGTFGRASFFSFGRDKIISSVYGGMAVTDDDILGERIKKFQEKCDSPSNFWILQQLLHPILTNFLIIPLYGIFSTGKWALLFLQKIKILSKAVQKKEKRGEKPNYIPGKMPGALAVLALNQFKKLEKLVRHQGEIAKFYDENLKDSKVALSQKEPSRVYMRYPLLLEDYDTDKILKEARRQKIFLDDGWRKTPIVPSDTNQGKMGYIFGSCPVAEKVARNILNLPTHINISKDDAQKIVNLLNISL